MKVLITKASNDFWYQIKEFNTLEELFNFKNECGHDIIISKNLEQSCPAKDLMKWWEGMKKEDAEIFYTLKYQIQIYDSWIE